MITSPSIYRVGVSTIFCDLTTPLFAPVDSVYDRLFVIVADAFFHVMSEAGLDDPVVHVNVKDADPVAVITLLPDIVVDDALTETIACDNYNN